MVGVPGEGTVRLTFLGGINEVGKNILALESDNDLIVVDFGLGFPDETQHGVDVVLPDVAWLAERRAKVRGIYITHGHEDHIGALPWLWADVRAPIHAPPLAAGLIAGKMREAGLGREVDIREFDPDSRPVLAAGDMTVEPFRVTHSIPDAVGFGITTPGGLIVHTGDFKFDPTPVDGKPTDIAAIEALSKRGVRLLISDCVHIETYGATPSERVVGATYEDVFAAASGRIIIATFASLIARIQQVIDVAHRHGRRVAPLGRSLVTNVQIAQDLGYLHDPGGVLVDERDAHRLPDNRIVYVVTGSQGEPMSVLSRIANRTHHEIEVHNRDTVVISATPIPGNETSVYRIIDQLFHQGAEVIYSSRARVHVSGHAGRDELRRMLDLVKPQHVAPTHGEYRHLSLYADLAREAGYRDDQIHLVVAGEVMEIGADGVRIVDRIETGRVFVEGRVLNAVDEATLVERDRMANEGIIVVAVAIDRGMDEVAGDPVIAPMGLVIELDDTVRSEMTIALRESLNRILARGPAEDAVLAQRVRSIAASYMFRGHRRRPAIRPVIVDVSSSHG